MLQQHLPAALRGGFLARSRFVLALAAVTTTLLLVPVVVVGELQDGPTEGVLAVGGLLLTAATVIRTYRAGATGTLPSVLPAIGLAIGATGLERPELVAVTLMFNACFQALYNSTPAAMGLAAAYAGLYIAVMTLAPMLQAVAAAPVQATMTVISLFLCTGVVRFLVALLTELERSEGRFRSLVQHASDAVTVLAEDGTVRYNSTSVTRVLGYTPTERLGEDAFTWVHPDDVEQASATVAAAIADPGVAQRIDLRYEHADGTWRWLELSITSMLHDPAVAGIVANYHDITARRELEDELRHQALHDPLTGMPNRLLFLDRLGQALARHRRPADTVAVFFCDLDEFKNVNDGMSHSAGDAVLAAVASRIGAVIRDSDTAARLGGDEFAVLVEDLADPEDALAVAERLGAAVRQPLSVEGMALSVGVSIGVAVGTAGCGAEELLRKADLAMHQAKRHGKGRVELYAPGLQQRVADRFSLRMELEAAIAKGELEPWYQPIVELASGRIVGVEALVRWRHPVRGLLPPADFIDVAEETGLIVPMGREMLLRSCRDLASWHGLPGVSDDLYVSVNVSPRQLQQPGLACDIQQILASCGLRPQQLMLEVTETMLVQDAASAVAALRQLRESGVRLALDDFGTGYSSLTHLRTFPMSVIKIDRSFVTSVVEQGEDRTVVETVVALATALGLTIVAEGVETAQHAQALLAMGCALAQGYRFAPPLPADDLLRLLTASPAAMATAAALR